MLPLRAAAFCFCLVGLAAAAVGRAASSQTNVLFLIADDLNCRLGCYGDVHAKTPNIDKLAARGVRFEHAYCNYPLCGPSRNSLLTGLYPNSSGILGNGQIFRQTIPNHVSLPQAFRQQGFFVGRLGKLYHYNVPNSIGTDGHDDPASWEFEMNPAGVDRLEEQPKITTIGAPGQFGATLSWYASPKGDEYHTDGKIARDAEWVLERCAKQKDRPFFLAVGFFRPHTPYVSPKNPYWDLYPEAQMPVVQGWKEDQADIPAAALASAKREQDEMTDVQRRQALQSYYAAISFMDAQVGYVVAALDRLGLAENTVIVFTSDHGYHNGEHGLWQKMSLFEGSSHVPLIIAAPRVSQHGAVAKTPVAHVDMYPTLAELSGVKTPDNLQGQSLVPMLKDPSAVGRGWALTQVQRGIAAAGKAGKNGKSAKAAGGEARKGEITREATAGGRFFGYTLRTARWRYTEWDEGRRGRELYDHEIDPNEITNVVNAAAHAKVVEDLSRQLHAAVKTSFPASGETPAIREGLWAPTLVAP